MIYPLYSDPTDNGNFYAEQVTSLEAVIEDYMKVYAPELGLPAPIKNDLIPRTNIFSYYEKNNDQRYRLPLPGTWDEMTAEQLCFLANILNSKSTAQEAKVKMLLFCLSARIRRYQKANGTGYAVSLPKDRIWITAEQLAALSTIFDFLFQETEKGIELDIRLTRNPFPVYKGKDIELYGPEDGLTNISYGQFIMLQTWQQRMRQEFLSRHWITSYP